MAKQMFFFTYQEVRIENQKVCYHLQVFQVVDNVPYHVGEVTIVDGSIAREALQSEAQKVILANDGLRESTVKRMRQEGRYKGNFEYYLSKYYDGAAVERFGYQIIDLAQAKSIETIF